MAFEPTSPLHNPAVGLAPPASWGDQVNDNFDALETTQIQHGITAMSFDVNGEATLTFPVAFTAIPTVTVAVAVGSDQRRYWHLDAVTTTSFSMHLFLNDVDENAVRTVHWQAVGTI